MTWSEGPFTIHCQTNGTTATPVRVPVTRWRKGVDVRIIKILIQLQQKSAQFEGRACWRFATTDPDSPGAWSSISNWVTTNDTKACSGNVDLSADSNLAAAMWWQGGVEFQNVSGTALETGDLTVLYSGKD